MNDMDKCKHEPDWTTLTINRTGWYGLPVYVDVSCKRCGQSGCIGTNNTMEVTWDKVIAPTREDRRLKDRTDELMGGANVGS